VLGAVSDDGPPACLGGGDNAVRALLGRPSEDLVVCCFSDCEDTAGGDIARFCTAPPAAAEPAAGPSAEPAAPAAASAALQAMMTSLNGRANQDRAPR